MPDGLEEAVSSSGESTETRWIDWKSSSFADVSEMVARTFAEKPRRASIAIDVGPGKIWSFSVSSFAFGCDANSR